MKYICSQTTCKHKTCVCRVEHEPSSSCNRVNKVCKPCVPVRPKRKPVTAWVVYAVDPRFGPTTCVFFTRSEARDEIRDAKRNGWSDVRGPVKVVVP